MRLIINADDFGYSADTVRATITCIEAGIVTSASIMPNMSATEAALEYARDCDRVSFGVHLTLADDWLARPVAPAQTVPGLVTRGGKLLPTNAVRARALFGPLSVDQLEREIGAQLDTVARRGIVISHVDSHRHLHKWPKIRQALVRVLPRYGISRVRTVQDIYIRTPLWSPTVWLGSRWRRQLLRQFETTDHLYLPATTNDRNWEPRLLSRLGQVRGETLEIGVHPGYDEAWRREELEAVERFTTAARRMNHVLVSWSDAFPRPPRRNAPTPIEPERNVSLGQ
jgi:predicted glycoside hydrolase/deacetylase ChbG (UPF0249 family)